MFSRSAELQQIGLAVPQVTRVCDMLREKGLPLSPDIYTIAQAKEQILTLYRRKGAQETC